ncbi:PAS domain-containing protein [Pedobacter arcticus]|uniref:PAS domain-containing protein n=1 Tax=Pedobacter arcticus TaxID=752140 RepID=UPI000306277A|nr:PAS domain-containing protein [Pedobacter arcticus]
MPEPLQTFDPEIQQSQTAIDPAQEALFVMKQAQELASFGNWVWDIATNSVTWSNTLYKIYGRNQFQFKATFEGYQEMLHPEDRSKIASIIGNALKTKKDVIFEERIIRPSGEIRYLRSWGCVKCDLNGNPQKMIGACLDITETKLKEQSIVNNEIALKKLVDQQSKHIKTIEEQNKKLNEISYIQSHVVRAPLAKIMGLTDLFLSHSGSPEEKDEICKHLEKVAIEFDQIITDIIRKTDT